MSLSFYDRNGKPYAYTDDDEHIFAFGGRPIGYLSNGSMYLFTGQHVGYFDRGIIRDDRGDALLFSDNASAGPVKPVKQVKPVKGVKQVMPVKGVRQVRPVRPVSKLGWSTYDLSDVFE
jgi:hypothetical protein